MKGCIDGGNLMCVLRYGLEAQPPDDRVEVHCRSAERVEGPLPIARSTSSARRLRRSMSSSGSCGTGSAVR